jgi:hypothetical protein
MRARLCIEMEKSSFIFHLTQFADANSHFGQGASKKRKFCPIASADDFGAIALAFELARARLHKSVSGQRQFLALFSCRMNI